MTRTFDASRRAVPAEIDNVVEHAAGLRSLADVSRILTTCPEEILELIRRGAFPDAYQIDGQWRIPLHDVRRLCSPLAGAHGTPAPTVGRIRRPHQGSRRPTAWLTPAERREIITHKLTRQSAVRTSSLSTELGVSQMTIRRDLAKLEAKGRLARVYGGALSLALESP